MPLHIRKKKTSEKVKKIMIQPAGKSLRSSSEKIPSEKESSRKIMKDKTAEMKSVAVKEPINPLEHGMDQDSAVREMLIEKRTCLLRELGENRERESDSMKRDIGDIYDDASLERERELSLLLGDRDRQKLIEIDEALQRVAIGEYGLCESCGEKISLGRLKAQPFTKLCINCKTEEEKLEARRRKIEAEGMYNKAISYSEEDEG